MQALLVELYQKEVAQGYINSILRAFPTSAAAITLADQENLLESLTNRESEILVLLAQRLTNQEIAERLVLSTGTVKQHLYNIYQKLNVKNRRQAIAAAKDLYILPKL